MELSHRLVMPRLRRAVALAAIGASLAGGCSDQPSTGTSVGESPELAKKREESVKSAMQSGAYGEKYKAKAAPAAPPAK